MARKPQSVKAPKLLRKPRGASKFKQSDLARAIRGAVGAGITIERVDVDPHTGAISIMPRVRNAVS